MQSRWVFTNPQESYLTKAQVGAAALPCTQRLLHALCINLPSTPPPSRPLPTRLPPPSCHPPTLLPQEVSLNYHMKCEQYAHSAARSFFNFNGTAGGWAGRRGRKTRASGSGCQDGSTAAAAVAARGQCGHLCYHPPLQVCGAWPASTTRAGGTGALGRLHSSMQGAQ